MSTTGCTDTKETLQRHWWRFTLKTLSAQPAGRFIGQQCGGKFLDGPRGSTRATEARAILSWMNPACPAHGIHQGGPLVPALFALASQGAVQKARRMAEAEFCSTCASDEVVASSAPAVARLLEAFHHLAAATGFSLATSLRSATPTLLAGALLAAWNGRSMTV